MRNAKMVEWTVKGVYKNWECKIATLEKYAIWITRIMIRTVGTFRKVMGLALDLWFKLHNWLLKAIVTYRCDFQAQLSKNI